MTVATRRKPQPQNAPAVDPVAALLSELVALQRVAVEHLAAIRAMTEETTQAPAAAISNNGDAPTSSLIDQADLMTFQQAAGEANVSEKTIRRWYQDHPEIGVTLLGNTTYIYKSKLRAHLAKR
jgi:hypothetical protein